MHGPATMRQRLPNASVALSSFSPLSEAAARCHLRHIDPMLPDEYIIPPRQLPGLHRRECVATHYSTSARHFPACNLFVSAKNLSISDARMTTRRGDNCMDLISPRARMRLSVSSEIRSAAAASACVKTLSWFCIWFSVGFCECTPQNPFFL